MERREDGTAHGCRCPHAGPATTSTVVAALNESFGNLVVGPVVVFMRYERAYLPSKPITQPSRSPSVAHLHVQGNCSPRLENIPIKMKKFHGGHNRGVDGKRRRPSCLCLNAVRRDRSSQLWIRGTADRSCPGSIQPNRERACSRWGWIRPSEAGRWERASAGKRTVHHLTAGTVSRESHSPDNTMRHNNGTQERYGKQGSQADCEDIGASWRHLVHRRHLSLVWRRVTLQMARPHPRILLLSLRWVHCTRGTRRPLAYRSRRSTTR
jgi:hypothetical protein